MGVFEVAKFESVLKFEVTPFLVGLVLIVAQNLCITRERWGIGSRRRLHRVSLRILRKGKALLRKFKKKKLLVEYYCTYKIIKNYIQKIGPFNFTDRQFRL